jgi:hypothetical protein
VILLLLEYYADFLGRIYWWYEMKIVVRFLLVLYSVLLLSRLSDEVWMIPSSFDAAQIA